MTENSRSAETKTARVNVVVIDDGFGRCGRGCSVISMLYQVDDQIVVVLFSV